MSPQIIPPSYVHHIFFFTKRLPAMSKFYKLVLGCEPFFENELYAWLTFDPQDHHRIALAQAPPHMADRAPEQDGFDHAGYQYRDPEELFATYERLAALGIEPFWCTNHGGTMSFYYKDPDGNGLELQYDNYESMEELVAWMQGGDFAKNPVGVDVDPKRLAQAHRDGVSRLDLHLQSRSGGFLPEGMTMEEPARPAPADPMAYMRSIHEAVEAAQ
ncbi:MAG: VOC family protein [Acidobacteriota bacterium]